MLCIIGYPAFAVDDEKLKEITGERVIENLMVIIFIYVLHYTFSGEARMRVATLGSV